MNAAQFPIGSNRWFAQMRQPDPPAPKPPPEPSEVPIYSIEIVDRDAVAKVDPLWPAVFPMWASLTEPTDLRDGDRIIARIAPAADGEAASGNLNLDGYDLLVSQLGVDDSSETTSAHELEGAAAMAIAMRDLPRLGRGLGAFRGEHEARLRMVEAIGRSYGMSPDSIARVTGRPFVARRSLLTPCSAVPALDAAKAAVAEARAKAQAEAEAIAAEAARPKSLGELGLEGIEVRTDSLALPRDPMGRPSCEPWIGAVASWTDGPHAYFVFRRVDGLDLPAFNEPGMRSLRADELVPSGVKLSPTWIEPSKSTVGFLLEVRARFGGAAIDRGPIDHARFNTKHVDRVRELAERTAPVSVSIMRGDYWRWQWAIGLAVRGWLCDPAVVSQVFVEAHAKSVRASGMRNIELAHYSDDPFGCLKFVDSGEVSIGCMLKPEPSQPTKKGRK